MSHNVLPLTQHSSSLHNPLLYTIFFCLPLLKHSIITALFEKISERNNIFVRTKEDNATTRRREQVIHSINTAVMEFHDMYSKLKQGQQFYGDLRERVDQLRQTVAGFVHTRALEARDTLLNIKRQDEMAQQVNLDQKYANDLVAPPQQQQTTTMGGVAVPTAPSFSSSDVPLYNASSSSNMGSAPPLRSSSSSDLGVPPSYNDAPPPSMYGNGGGGGGYGGGQGSYQQPSQSLPTYTPSTTGSPTLGLTPVQPPPAAYSSPAAPPAYVGGSGGSGGSGGGYNAPPSYGGSTPQYNGGSGSSGVSVGAGWGGRPAHNPTTTAYGGTQQAPPSYGGGGGGGGGAYAAELSQLAGMGFTDRSKNIALLQKHNGNLQEAVAELL